MNRHNLLPKISFLVILIHNLFGCSSHISTAGTTTKPDVVLQLAKDNKPLAIHIACHPTQSIVAVGTNDSHIYILDTNTGTTLKTLTGHDYEVSWTAFSPDGRWLATIDYPTTIIKGPSHVIVWNTKTWEENKKLSLQISEGIVGVRGGSTVGFSPDSQIVFWTRPSLVNGKIKLIVGALAISAGEPFETEADAVGGCPCIAFEQDESTFLFAAGKLWRVNHTPVQLTGVRSFPVNVVDIKHALAFYMQRKGTPFFDVELDPHIEIEAVNMHSGIREFKWSINDNTLIPMSLSHSSRYLLVLLSSQIVVLDVESKSIVGRLSIDVPRSAIFDAKDEKIIAVGGAFSGMSNIYIWHVSSIGLNQSSKLFSYELTSPHK